MQTEAQKRACAKYKRDKVKQLLVAFYPNDAELWAALENEPNKAGLVKALLRAHFGLDGKVSEDTENTVL